MRKIQFRGNEGFRIKGKTSILSKENRIQYVNEKLHVSRAFMLTFLVESGGVFGSVMNYDGTVMTAGACQNILVYPRELRKEDFQSSDDQGSLPFLLVAIERSCPHLRPLRRLFEMFHEEGWYLSGDGKIRWRKDVEVIVGHRPLRLPAGEVVHGETLKSRIISPTGKLEPEGKQRERAVEWIQTFHEVFSDPSTFQTQVLFELSHNIALRAARYFEGKVTFEKYFYKKDILEVRDLPPKKDLAMCFFWCNYVNAPGKAMAVIRKCRKVPHTRFSTALINGLGNTSFARWDDDIENGRYRRVRRAAKKLGYWPESFFEKDGIMPMNLPG